MMICILKFEPDIMFRSGPGASLSIGQSGPVEPASSGFITGWIIATDLHDARRQVPFGDESADLADALGRIEVLPPGKHQLTAQYVALVTP